MINSLLPWLLVTGDFVRTGGMDIANYMLARHLAGIGHEVHLVAHRVADDLAALPGTHVHLVPKPLNSYFLGAPLLDHWGQHHAQKLAGRGRTVVNGGNCFWGDVNWAHYVHAAYAPTPPAGLAYALKARLQHARFAADERRCLERAHTVIANSERTREDLMIRLGLPEEKIKVVYYGIDAEDYLPVGEDEKNAIRRGLGWKDDGRMKAVFIGALGDDRKGFDLLFGAWKTLCADPAWNVDLVVIGGGHALTGWQARTTADPALRDRIEFLGFRRDVSRLLPGMDMLVAPTRYEAYGLGVHEALCCGLPCIVSCGAGVAERFSDALRPLLLDELSVPALVGKLRHWQAAHRRWTDAARTLGAALRAQTWETQMQAFVNLVEAS